jgi:hypothetical protein
MTQGAPVTLLQLYPECLQAIRDELATRGSLTMTDATEVIFGSSGRGCPKAVKLIEYGALKGDLVITAKGRTRTVTLPAPK